jgi:hypothetical protein
VRVLGFYFNEMWIKFVYEFVKNIYEHGNAENSRLVGEDRQ